MARTPNRPAVGIGARIRELREKKGWKQADLAERSGLSPSIISQIESGERPNPLLSTLQDLERAFGEKLAPDIIKKGADVGDWDIDQSLDRFMRSSLGRQLAPEFPELQMLRSAVDGVLFEGRFHPIFWGALLESMRKRGDVDEAAVGLGCVVDAAQIVAWAEHEVADANATAVECMMLLRSADSYETTEAKVEQWRTVEQAAREQGRRIDGFLRFLERNVRQSDHRDQAIEKLRKISTLINDMSTATSGVKFT